MHALRLQLVGSLFAASKVLPILDAGDSPAQSSALLLQLLDAAPQVTGSHLALAGIAAATLQHLLTQCMSVSAAPVKPLVHAKPLNYMAAEEQSQQASQHAARPEGL